MKKILLPILLVPFIISGCSGGLPSSCSSAAAESTYVDIVKVDRLVQGNQTCVNYQSGVRAVPKDGICGAEMKLLSDTEIKLTSISVKQERKAEDGKSINCRIAADSLLTSKTGNLNGPAHHEFSVIFFAEKKDGKNYQYKME